MCSQRMKELKKELMNNKVSNKCRIIRAKRKFKSKKIMKIK